MMVYGTMEAQRTELEAETEMEEQGLWVARRERGLLEVLRAKEAMRYGWVWVGFVEFVEFVVLFVFCCCVVVWKYFFFFYWFLLLCLCSMGWLEYGIRERGCGYMQRFIKIGEEWMFVQWRMDWEC